jgi:hypothetical protein
MRHGGISRKKMGISSGAENVWEKLGEFGPFVGEFRKIYLATLQIWGNAEVAFFRSLQILENANLP